MPSQVDSRPGGFIMLTLSAMLPAQSPSLPELGDIFVFGSPDRVIPEHIEGTPIPRVDMDAQTLAPSRGAAAPPPGRRCQLSSDTMTRSRGSLFVYGSTRATPDARGTVTAHWEGGPTSRSRDCGPSVDLSMDARDLAALSAMGEIVRPHSRARLRE